MKHLKFLFSLSLILAMSVSVYGQDDTEDDPDNDDNGSGVPTVTCRTNQNIISETFFPCGSGFAVATTWRLSCTSGNTGTCSVGTFTVFSGCEDGELPEEDSPNITTVTCRR